MKFQKRIWGLSAFVSIFFLIGAVFAAPIQLTDMAGRKVTLLAPAKRIISIMPSNTICVLALGLEDRLIAADHETQKNPIAVAMRPNFTKLPPAGKSNTVFLETVMGLKPDLVILSARKEGLSTANRLEQMGIPTLVVHPETFEKMDTSIRLIAEATGTEKRGEFVCKTLQDTLQKAEKKVASISLKDRKKVYYAGPSNFFYTTSKNLLQADMIKKAGGIVVSEKLNGYFQVISPEQFIRWKPDVILVNGRTTDEVNKIIKQPQFQRVPAIQHNAVYVFPDGLAYWDFPSPLAALGVLWTAYQIYPERFLDVPFEKEADAFYQALFNLSWPIRK